VVQSLWYLRRAPPVATVLEPFVRVVAWADRMAAFGHGSSQRMSSAQAIETAAAAAAAGLHAPAAVDAGAGFAAGQAVTVAATDYATDAVAGTIVGLTRDEVVLERHDERAGRVHVHFPRIGFQIRKQSTEDTREEKRA
jgi:hypothetical protein